MIWVIQTSEGVFEAERYKEALKRMINYYVERDEEPHNIEGIYCLLKKDRVREICSKGIARFEEKLFDEVSALRRISNENYSGRQEIESDYYANLL